MIEVVVARLKTRQPEEKQIALVWRRWKDYKVLILQAALNLDRLDIAVFKKLWSVDLYVVMIADELDSFLFVVPAGDEERQQLECLIEVKPIIDNERNFLPACRESSSEHFLISQHST